MNQDNKQPSKSDTDWSPKVFILLGFVGAAVSAALFLRHFLEGAEYSAITFESVKKWLELVSFACSPIVAIAACAALWQLKIAREQLLHAERDFMSRSEREAVCLAAQKCREWATEVIPLVDKEIPIIRGRIQLQQWQMLDYEFREKSFAEPGKAKEWAKKAFDANAHDPIIHILNQFEAAAMFFTTGAADDEVAFPAIGIMFHAHVTNLAPYIMALREGLISPTSGKFAHTVRLYGIWAARIKAERLGAEVDKLQQELNTVPKTKIKRLGT